MDVEDYIVGGVFFIILLYVIIRTRKNKTFESFSVSNRNLGTLIIFASLSATFIGPGFSLALVNQGYNTGLFYILIAGAYGLSKIFEGLVVSSKLRKKFPNAFSIGDVIAGENSHNNKTLHIITGIISFGLLMGFSAVIAKAGGEVFYSFFNIPSIYGIIIITTIVAFYSFFGGIKASIYTDAFQFVVFIIIMPLLLIFAVSSADFDSAVFSDNINKLTELNINKTSGLQFFSLLITWFFGEMLIPPTINRILSTKNEKSSKKSLVFSGFFMIIWLLLMLLLGVLALTNGVNTEHNDQILLIMGKQYFKFGLYGVFVIALLSIVMSSLDSLLNSASVIFVQDIFGVTKKLDNNKKLVYARISTVVIAVLAIVLSTYFTSILQGLLFVYSIWAPAIVVVLLASVFLKNNYWQAGIVAIIGGVLGSVLWKLTPYNEFFPSILMGILVSFGLYASVYIFLNTKYDKN